MLTDMITYNLCRLLCQHSLCFQSLPHSFSLPLRIFNNLHTLCIVKSDLSPVESSIAALFPKKQGCTGYRRNGLSVSPPPSLQTSNALIAPRVPLRYLQTLQRLFKSLQWRAIRCQNHALPCKNMPRR